MACSASRSAATGPPDAGLGAADRRGDRALHRGRRAGRARRAVGAQLHRLGVPDRRRRIGGAVRALARPGVHRGGARSQWRPGLIAGACSIVTYGLALWAFRLGATPRLAALRETSILFGVVIAIVFLKERYHAPASGRGPDRRGRGGAAGLRRLSPAPPRDFEKIPTSKKPPSWNG